MIATLFRPPEQPIVNVTGVSELKSSISQVWVAGTALGIPLLGSPSHSLGSELIKSPSIIPVPLMFMPNFNSVGPKFNLPATTVIPVIFN